MTVTGPPDDYASQLKEAAHEVFSMTDIVERCEYCGQEERYGHNAVCVMRTIAELEVENADLRAEIEKLRQEGTTALAMQMLQNERLQKRAEAYCEMWAKAEALLDEQDKELKRLRAALDIERRRLEVSEEALRRALEPKP